MVVGIKNRVFTCNDADLLIILINPLRAIFLGIFQTVDETGF